MGSILGGMRTGWFVVACLGASSCTMVNPAFEDGAIADEVGDSDERVESSDERADETGSSGAEGVESSTSEGESSSSDTQSTSDSTSDTMASSSDDVNDTTDTGTGESESTDTGSMACMALEAVDECEACKIESCCTDDNLDCFDADKLDECSCVLDCIGIGGLINVCGLQCGLLQVDLLVVDDTQACILEACGELC